MFKPHTNTHTMHGRSMVEVLAVIGIMALLAAGAILWLPDALGRNRANKLFSEFARRSVALSTSAKAEAEGPGGWIQIPGTEKVSAKKGEETPWFHCKENKEGSRNFIIIARNVTREDCHKWAEMVRESKTLSPRPVGAIFAGTASCNPGYSVKGDSITPAGLCGELNSTNAKDRLNLKVTYPIERVALGNVDFSRTIGGGGTVEPPVGGVICNAAEDCAIGQCCLPSGEVSYCVNDPDPAEGCGFADNAAGVISGMCNKPRWTACTGNTALHEGKCEECSNAGRGRVRTDSCVCDCDATRGWTDDINAETQWSPCVCKKGYKMHSDQEECVWCDSTCQGTSEDELTHAYYTGCKVYFNTSDNTCHCLEKAGYYPGSDMISDFSDCVYCPVKNYTDRHYIDYVWGSIFYDRTKKECTCSVPGLKWSEENKICQATCEGDANGYPLLFNDDFAALRWSNETTIDTDALRDSKLLKSKFERTQLCVVCNKDEDCGDYKSCYSIDAADGTTTDWRYPNDQEWTSIVNEKTILINGVKTKIIQVPDSWLTKTTYDDIKESFCDWWNSPLMAPGFKGGKTCDEKFAEYRSEVLKPNVLVVGKEFAGEFDQGVRFKLCGSKQECGANQFKYVEYFTGSAKIAVELRISCRDLSMPSTLTCTRTSAAEDTCFKGGPGYAGVFSNLTGYEEYIGCVDPANGLCGCFGTATLSGLTPVAGTYKVNDTPVKGTPKCTCNSGEYLPDWGSYNTNLCSNQSFGNGHFTCPGQTAEEYFKNKHIVTMCRNLENFQSYTFYYYDNVRDDAGNPTCEQGHTLEGCFKAKKPATLYTSKNFRKGIALVAAPTATVADNIAAANVCGAVLNGMMLTSADQYTSGIDTLDAYCNIKKATKRALKTFVKDDTGNKWNQYSDKHVAQEVCLPSNPKDAEPKDIVKACEKETGAIVPLCVTTVYNGCCADAGDDDDSTDNTCANTLCNPNDIFLKGIQYIRGPSSTCRVMSRCFNELKRSFIDGCANGTNKTGAKACLKDKLKQLKACSTNWNKCKDIKLDDCASSCYQQTVKPALFDQWYSNGPSCDTGASGEGVNIVDKFDKARYDCGATPEICDDAWKEVSDLVAKYIAGSEVYDDGK